MSSVTLIQSLVLQLFKIINQASQIQWFNMTFLSHKTALEIHYLFCSALTF